MRKRMSCIKSTANAYKQKANKSKYSFVNTHNMILVHMHSGPKQRKTFCSSLDIST